MEIKNGFTLAEVLITLVIIGIIATITILSLINKTNEQETVVAVKKAYSTVSQAYQKVIAENGEIIPSTLGADSAEATKTLGEMFVKQLSAGKICGQSNNEDCFSNEMYRFFNGNDWYLWNVDTDKHYKCQLNDGMSLAIFSWGNFESYGTNQPLNFVFGDIYVDINGDKGPNVLGKDIFNFWITKYGVIPSGTPNDTYRSIATICDTGWGSTAWVITKGNMDYLRKDVSW